MEDTILIREVKEEDAEAILEYLRQIGGESPYLSFGEEGLPYDVESEEKVISGILSSENSMMYLAVRNTKIIGMCHLMGSSRKKLAHRGEIAISVLKDYQGKGIATEMMHRMIEFAKSKALEIISLEVVSSNTKAMKLYRKFGFEKYGFFEKFFKTEEGYMDAHYMMLHL